MKSYDIIIVGAGIAGMTAAIYARRAGKSVLVLEKQIQGGQIIQTLSIANWPGDVDISGPDLTQKIYHQVNNLGAEISYETVEKITITDNKESNSRFLVKTDESEYSSGAIIIASGTVPRTLDNERMKEVGKRPISFCATCDGAFYKGKPVAVIGRGKTAEYDISYLKNIASKVYSIYRNDKIPEDAAAIFVAIGRDPNTDFLKGIAELDEKGYVIADESCKTTTPGIFVAGDCRTKDVRQLVTAAGDGAISAEEAVKYLG